MSRARRTLAPRPAPCAAVWTAEGRLALSPLPPLANRLWRRGLIRRGLWRIPVTYKTDEAKAWQEAMAWRLRAAGLAPWSELTCARDLRVSVWLFFPDARRRDPDSIIKLFLDTLATALRMDDRYFLPRIEARKVDRTWPRLELAVEGVFDDGLRLPASEPWPPVRIHAEGRR